ncbi:1990_t:CDS:2, partial [Dentiscutata erythropus]
AQRSSKMDFRSRILFSHVLLKLTLRSDLPKPLLSNSYTNSSTPPYTSSGESYMRNFAKKTAKRPPATLGTKVLLSVIGLVSMDLFYAWSRSFYNEYLLHKTVQNGNKPELNIPEHLLVHRPQ